MAVICVDFDHTICDSSNVDHPRAVPPPLPGAREALSKLREAGHKIVIFSCNNPKWIEKWLTEYGIPVDSIWSDGKPTATYYIDDRAIRFKSWAQVLTEMKEDGLKCER